MRWEVRMLYEDGRDGSGDYRNACIYDVDTGERILRCAGGLPEKQASHVVKEHNKCLMAPTGLMRAGPKAIQCYDCGTEFPRSEMTKSMGQRYRCGPCQKKCDVSNEANRL